MSAAPFAVGAHVRSCALCCLKRTHRDCRSTTRRSTTTQRALPMRRRSRSAGVRRPPRCAPKQRASSTSRTAAIPASATTCSTRQAACGLTTPVAVFIHGGYWQWRDRRDFAFTAAGALAHGVAWAMPSYRQCPEVRIADIVEDMRAFLVTLWRRTGRRAVVSGALGRRAPDGGDAGDGLVDDRRRPGKTSSELVMPSVACSRWRRWSAHRSGWHFGRRPERDGGEPALSVPLPPKGSWLTAAVGGSESGEFIRQSADMARHWSEHNIAAEAVVVPGANHFTVIDDLARPHSAMAQRIVAMARACLRLTMIHPREPGRAGGKPSVSGSAGGQTLEALDCDIGAPACLVVGGGREGGFCRGNLSCDRRQRP